LEELVKKTTDRTRLLRIDIGKWGSPVAEQYGIRSLPTVWLYEGTDRTTGDTRKALARLSE
jgi:hypothetical protein